MGTDGLDEEHAAWKDAQQMAALMSGWWRGRSELRRAALCRSRASPAAAMAQATHVAVVVLLPATMRTSGNGHMLLECGPLCEVPAEGAVSLHTRTDLAGGSWLGEYELRKMLLCSYPNWYHSRGADRHCRDPRHHSSCRRPQGSQKCRGEQGRSWCSLIPGRCLSPAAGGSAMQLRETRSAVDRFRV